MILSTRLRVLRIQISLPLELLRPTQANVKWLTQVYPFCEPMGAEGQSGDELQHEMHDNSPTPAAAAACAAAAAAVPAAPTAHNQWRASLFPSLNSKGTNVMTRVELTVANDLIMTTEWFYFVHSGMRS